jgi:hypothetical protein
LDADKKYIATIYKDAPTADWDTNPEAYIIETKEVSSKTQLSFQLARSGGYAISIKPKN